MCSIQCVLWTLWKILSESRHDQTWALTALGATHNLTDNRMHVVFVVSSFVTNVFVLNGPRYTAIRFYDCVPYQELCTLVFWSWQLSLSCTNIRFLFRCVQIAGHSAGAHLAACLFDGLVQQSPPLTSIVKSLYLISGIYDVSEVRYMPTVNPNNILSLDENNVLRLSPILFEFDKWAAAARNGTTSTSTPTTATATSIHLFVGTNDAPKLVAQSYCLERLLAFNRYPNYELVVMENIDHFDIVENLSKADFFITKKIIDDAKLFVKGEIHDKWYNASHRIAHYFVHIKISCNIFTSFQLKKYNDRTKKCIYSKKKKINKWENCNYFNEIQPKR